MLDDSHTGYAYFQFVQHAGAGEDAVERSQGRAWRVDLFRIAADAPQEALKRGLMEMLFVELAVFFDQVMQDVDARFRIGNASHERRHWAWEKRHGMKELLLAASKTFEAHGTILQRLQIQIAPDA